MKTFSIRHGRFLALRTVRIAGALLIATTLALSGCGSGSEAALPAELEPVQQEVEPTATPTATPSPTPTPVPTPTSTPIPLIELESDSGTSLGAAVRDASPQSIIRLGPGDYPVPLTIRVDKPLTIEGTGRDSTRLVGGPDVVDAIVLISNTSEVEVSGLAIEHTGSNLADSIEVRSSSARIRGVAVSGGQYGTLPVESFGELQSGVHVIGESDVRVADSLMTSNHIGARVGDDATVEFVAIESVGNQLGVAFFANSTGTLSESLLARNSEAGLYINSAAGEPSTLVVSDSRFEDNDIGAIIASGAPRLLDNTAGGNRVGFRAREYAAPEITRNLADGNSEAGFQVVEEASGTLTENEATGSSTGFLIDTTGGGPELIDNRASSNASGFTWRGSATGSAVGNTAADHEINGFLIADESSPVLERNLAEDNDAAGFAWLGTSGGVANENHASGNDVGYAIDEAAVPMLTRNTGEENETPLLLRGSAAELLDNQFEPEPETTTVPSLDFAIGTCFDIAETANDVRYLVLDCSVEHELEKFAELEHPAASGEPFPGSEALSEFASEACLERFADYVGVPYAESIYGIATFTPVVEGWLAGRRQVSCAINSFEGLSLIGAAAGSGR